MSSVEHGDRWDTVKTQGSIVYWCRPLPDGSWLAVCKTRDGEAIAVGDNVAKRVGGPWWMWMHCGPTPEVVQASAGGFELSRLARDAADRYLHTVEVGDEFEIPDMAEVAATAALAGVRSGSSVQIVRVVLAAGGPHLMAAAVRSHAATLDACPLDEADTAAYYRRLGGFLRDWAIELEQGTL